MTKKNKQELNDLLVKANELRHRDSKGGSTFAYN